MELAVTPSASVRPVHPSVETMVFPSCLPAIGDSNPDSVPGLTADEFAQYLFSKFFDKQVAAYAASYGYLNAEIVRAAVFRVEYPETAIFASPRAMLARTNDDGRTPGRFRRSAFGLGSVQGRRCTHESLQRFLVDLLAFAKIDGAPCVAFEA